jgi:hypothetical protein
VHRTTLAISNTLSATQQFADDRLDGSTTHQSETVASVGGDDIVFLGERVFDADGDGFLTG